MNTYFNKFPVLLSNPVNIHRYNPYKHNLLEGFDIFFKILFIFRERGRAGEREGEKHQCVVASHMPPTGELAHSPSMGPDWESNQ